MSLTTVDTSEMLVNKATKEAHMSRSVLVAAAQRSRRWLTDSGSRSRRIAVVALLGLAIGVLAGWWSSPPVAAAATCNVHYNTVATNNTQNFSNYGVRVTSPGMKVYGGGAACVHVSSLEAMSNNADGDEAEVGWHIQASGYSTCNSTGDNTPHVFYTWVAYGVYSCHEASSFGLSVGTSYSFSVRADLGDNKPNTWIYDFNGNVLTTHDNGFSSSASLTNGERHSTNESAQALFNGMQFRTSTDQWTAWGHSACWSGLSNDPTYNNQLLSNTEVQVTTGAPQC